ncbi:glycerate kinase [Lacihabitans soyangensis]|uniref:Glycerate kinase n=1 Tax=Lacihabitans soyangensis TaxID=869394 RepID=A0AAE3H2M7_9BACT|nr:glycerate kinase [Lacihabitans soyangensis]MCP9763783.1 glycerate kinase [Lacihabitans soyangensis]
MRILIAPDSFKDSLSAAKVAESLARGIKSTFPEAEITLLPLADGGEGTLEAIKGDLEYVKCMASDPLFRKIESKYLWDEKTKTAFVEMAQISGLELVTENERNPLKTTTLGTGELIANALKRKAKKVILFVGGSATNDGGIGMAAALGYIFLDKKGNTLNPTGENLNFIHDFDYQPTFDLSKTEFIVATDVTNPFYGENGAAHIYAKQKGANPEQIDFLDKGLQNLNRVLKKNKNIDLQTVAGSGAAGGLAGGAYAFLGAKVVSAAEEIFKICDLETKIEQSDIIVSGEGRIDSQTWNGKLISKLLENAKQKSVILVGGSVETDLSKQLNIIKAYQIKTPEMTLDYAKANAAELLFETGKEIGNLLN